MINGFTGQNAFLSNFYLYPIIWKNRILPSAEHAYQGEKPTDELEQEMIHQARTPGQAKKLGSRKHCRSCRPDWEIVKLDIMTEVIRAKFSDPAMTEMLKATGQEELIERNWWNDTYWGVCNNVGENHLGKILMRVRETL